MIKDVLQTAFQSYRTFFGSGIYLALFVAALIYLLVKEEEISIKKFLLVFFAVFGVVYVCPATAYVIMEYCIGESVYWRMFWILPLTVMIAYILTKEIYEPKEGWKKCVMAIGVVLLITQSGSLLYHGTFGERQNGYKLYLDVVLICDAIEEDAKEQGIEKAGLIAANELISQIRQYDAGIRMPYGRNALKNENMSKRAGSIFSIMCNGELNAQALAENAREGGYQYLAYPKELYREEILGAGYVLIAPAGSFDVYRLEYEAVHTS